MVVYLFAGRCTRKEKVRQRRNIELEDAALSEKTKTRYYLALRKLLPYFESAECLDDLEIKYVPGYVSCGRQANHCLL